MTNLHKYYSEFNKTRPTRRQQRENPPLALEMLESRAMLALSPIAVVGTGTFGSVGGFPPLHQFAITGVSPTGDATSANNVVNIPPLSATATIQLRGTITGPAGSANGHGNVNVVASGTSVSSNNFQLAPNPPNGANQLGFSFDVTLPRSTSTFTYTVTDNFHSPGGALNFPVNSLSGTVSVNNRPIANADSYRLDEGKTLLVDVREGLRENDLDGDGDGDLDGDGEQLTVISSTDPTHGRFVRRPAADGTFVYEPKDVNFNGNDTFTYVVSDGYGVSEVGVVTITVRPVNDAPVAVDDNYSFPEKSKPRLSVLCNDTDPDDTDPNGDCQINKQINKASIEISALPQHGTATPNSDGSITYSPMDDSFFGTDSFKYRVQDIDGLVSNEATVSLTIDSVLDKPRISEYVDNVPSNQGRFPFVFGVRSLTNDNMPQIRGISEAGSQITLRRDSLSGPILGTTTAQPDQTWEIQLNSPIGDGTLILIAEATDGKTTPASDPVTIEIDTRVNPPSIHGINIDSGVGDDQITNDPTPQFLGAGDASEPHGPVKIGVKLADGGPEIGSGTVDENGAWAVSWGQSIPALADGSYSFIATAEDDAGNTVSSGPFSVSIDQTGPSFVDDGPVKGDPVKLAPSDQQASPLPIPVTSNQTPTIEFLVEDRRFLDKGNVVRLELQTLDRTVLATKNLPIAAGTVGLVSSNESLKVSVPLSGGQQNIRIVATDSAGNSTTSPSFTFFVSIPGKPTNDAPGTPVHVTLYDLPSVLGIPNLRPWSMAFDKTTQTTWFTMEDGHRLGQFDPATDKVYIYDVNFVNPKSDGATTATSVDPHGIFFDFNTHLTPRVWFVYRNNTAVPGSDLETSETGRIGYFDLATGELFSFGFDALKLSNADGTELIEEDFKKALKGAHNIIVDSVGTVWMTAEDSNAIVEIEFDRNGMGQPNPDLNSKVGQAIVHRIPDAFGDRGSQKFPFRVHGLQAVIDQRTNERWVWFSDAGRTDASGRVGLLRAGRPQVRGVAGMANSAAIQDTWYEWDFDLALQAEGRIGAPNGHVLFLNIDDRETPGIPEDDRLVFGDGGPPGLNPEGAVRSLEIGPMVKALQRGEDVPDSLTLHTARVTKIPGAATTSTYAATLQVFSDREGTLYYLDAAGGVGRVTIDDPGVQQDITSIVVPLRTTARSDVHFGEVEMKSAVGTALTRSEFSLRVSSSTNNTSSPDQAQQTGVDEYVVAASRLRNPGGGGGGDGPFRGALNAANIVYGSIAQSDKVSTTIFAETARRQMDSVITQTSLANGVARGRAAFSVRRDGSLILTGRGDGQLLDQQLNLSELVANVSKPKPQRHVNGDPSAVVDSRGVISVFALDQTGGVVRFRYRGPSNWHFDSLSTASNWDVTNFSAAGSLLIGEPSAFLDSSENAGALVTTELGHLLLYSPHVNPSPINLTADRAGNSVYSSVAVLARNQQVFVYGTNQTGELIEYRFPEAVSSSKDLRISDKILMPTVSAEQVDAEVQVFQSVNAVATGNVHHIFAVDGNARLVHYELNLNNGNVFAENVTLVAQANNQVYGYFTFQQSPETPFGGRVYTELAPLVAPDGTLYVYGTNGQDLVEFKRLGNSTTSIWQVANLTNDIHATAGANRGDAQQPPRGRVPANFVFGAPSAYVLPNGDRHVLQINADGEVVEYYYRNAGGFPRFHTQNISLRLSPLARDDAYRVEPGQSLAVPAKTGVLANDRSLPSAKARLVTPPARGKVTLRDDGSFTYTPVAQFIGTDTFRYQSFDGLNVSGLGTVTIQGNPIAFPIDSGNFLAADVNGDHRSDLVASIGGRWLVALSVGNGFDHQDWGPSWHMDGFVDIRTADVNGDGNADIVGRHQGDWWVALSNGSHQFRNQVWAKWSTAVTWFNVSMADVDGDGRSDIIGRETGGGWWVARSTGSQFRNELWTHWNPFVSWRDVVVADVNGDGRDDIAGRANGEWWVARSTGNQFLNASWTHWATHVVWTDVLVADVNGDGKDDIVGRAIGEWWSAISDGTRFRNERYGWWSPTADWRDVQRADVNGDGRADVVGRTGNGGWWGAISGSRGFENIALGVWNSARWSSVFAADFDGDGRSDVVGDQRGTWRTGLSTGTALLDRIWGSWHSP